MPRHDSGPGGARSARRPQRRPRRGGHRRRGAAGGGHQRQRRLRLPRRQRRDHARGLRRGRRLGVSVGAQVSYDDRRELRPGRPRRRRTTLLRDQVADQVGDAARDRRGGGHDGALPQAARRALPPGASTTRSRRGRCWTGPATCRCSGCRAVAARRWRPRPGGRRPARGLPRPRRTATDGRLVPRTSPGAVLGRRDDDRGPGAWSWRATVDSVCVHGDSPGAVGHARAVRGRSRPPAGCCAGLCDATVHRTRPEICGRIDRRSCGPVRHVLWRSLWDREVCRNRWPNPCARWLRTP